MSEKLVNAIEALRQLSDDDVKTLVGALGSSNSEESAESQPAEPVEEENLARS